MARYGRQSSTFQSKKAAPQFHEKPVSQAVDWEKRLLEKIRAAGLPEPVREHLFARPIKRRWRADFAYPDAVPPILIEVEGGIWTRGRHTRGSGYEDDCRKCNKANLLGFIKIGRKTQGLQPWDISPSLALAALASHLTGTSVL